MQSHCCTAFFGLPYVTEFSTAVINTSVDLVTSELLTEGATTSSNQRESWPYELMSSLISLISSKNEHEMMLRYSPIEFTHTIKRKEQKKN